MVSLCKGQDKRLVPHRPCIFTSSLDFQSVIRAWALPDKYKKIGGEKMKLLTKKLKAKIPSIGSQDEVFDPMVICKYFDPTGSWTWYVMEGEEREDGTFEFYGYVVGDFPEFGYFTLRDLETAKQNIRGIKALPIERDIYFTPCRLSEITTLHSRK